MSRLTNPASADAKHNTRNGISSPQTWGIGGASSVFFRWLGTVALALWLGGLVGIGALVAPVTAHFLTAHPELDPTVKAQLLTAIVGGSLRVFNIVCDVCGVLLLLSQWALWKQTPRRVAVTGLVVTLVLLASALYLGFGLFPQMDAAQSAGRMNEFDALHKRYEAFSTQLQLPLLLVLAACFALRDTRR